MPKKSHSTIRTLLIIALIFAPIPFGSVHVWAYSILNLLVLAAGVVWGIEGLRRGGVVWVRTPVDGFVLGFFLWVGVQMVPLPLSVMEWVSPQGAAVWQGFFQTVGWPSGWKPLSLVVHATRLAWVQGIVFVLVFQLTAQVFGKREYVIRLTRVLIILGACLALYGLFENLSGHDHILWWKHQWQRGSFRVCGTFINPDHFGFYLNLIIPLALGYIYRARFRPREQNASRDTRSLFRRLVDGAIDPGAKAQKTGLLVFFTAIMMAVCVLTGSRAALLAMGGSFAVMAGLVWLRTRRRGFALLLLGAVALAGIYGAQIGLAPVIQRWQHMEKFQLDRDARWIFWGQGLEMVRDYPLTGTGLGTTEEVLPAYPPHDKPYHFTDHLHNDWLEILAETGIPGFLCVLGGYIGLFIFLIQRWRHTSSTLTMGITLGALGALTAAGIHSLLDFSLHMPANGVTLAAILGLGAAGRPKNILHRRG